MRLLRDVVTGLLLIFLFGGTVRADHSPPSPSGGEFFDLFMGDLREELQTVREEGKKGILLFFEIDSCPFCIRMKQRVLSRPEVRTFFEKSFLRYSIDVEGDVELTDFQGKTMRQKDFALSHRVRATPTMIFYDPEGKEITRYVGAMERPGDFLLLGEYVTKGVYREMPFIRYKRLHHRENKE